MDKSFEEKLLAESLWIGEHLADNAKVATTGIVWDTISDCDSEGNVFWGQNPSIYNGVSGILLFYIKLYRYTNDAKHLKLIDGGLAWIEDFCKHQEYPLSFYHGRLGVVYTLTEIYQVTNDPALLLKAKNYTEGIEKELQNNTISFGLAEGVSGMLLGLLHLYCHTKDHEILVKIKLCTQYLINNMNYGEKGVYWGNYRDTIRGLCSFAQGNAGIAFVLFELALLSKNPVFSWLAEYAISYEDFYYNDEKKNWPDFRKKVNWLYELGKYKEGQYDKDNSFFYTPSNTFTWSHGAPGILLSRLKSINISDNHQHKQIIENTIQKMDDVYAQVGNKEKLSYTLDYGFGGFAVIAILLMRCSVIKNDAEWINAIANNALQQRRALGFYSSGFFENSDAEDFSLFMGTAGVGYMFLSLLSFSENNAFSPSLPKTENATLRVIEKELSEFNLYEIKIKILSSIYPKTIEYYHNKIGNINFNLDNELKDNIIININRQSESNREVFLRLRELYDLEFQREKLRSSPESNALSYLEYLALQDANEKILEDEKILSKCTLCVTHSVKLLELKWKLTDGDWMKNIEIEPSQHIILLQRKPSFVVEYLLNRLNFVLIKSFESPSRLSKVLTQLTREYDEDERKSVEAIIIKQVKELLSAGIITGKVKNMLSIRSLFS